MDDRYRQLRAEKLIETAERLTRRLRERFPNAGLAEVSATVVDVVREATVTAERIQRPDWWLRGALLALAVLVVAGAVAAGVQLAETPLARTLEIVRAASMALIYLGAAVAFFWTLETRLKRGRAIKAIHQLRALAHIIDMHQLTKDPDRITPAGQAVLEDGQTMTSEAMGYYLNFCTELLAIISKIGQLYVQDFPDGTTLAAVDQFESLATGLSQKIWQKLMILERVQAGVSEAEGPKA